MMPFQAFFEFIPILVGSIFTAVGFFSLKNFLSLRRNGSRVKGEVKGVEKYVSSSGSGSQKTSSVMYCPVVNYTFEGQMREVRGLSVSHLRHHLGQEVEVLVRKNAPNGGSEASIDDSLNVGLGFLFLAVGLGAVGFGATLKTASLPVIVVTIVLVIGLGSVVERLLRVASSPGDAAGQVEGGENQRRLITDPKEFDQEVVLHKKIGYVIALVSVLGGLWIMYTGLSQLSAEEFALLTSQPLSLLKSASTKKPAMLAGIGGFFTLAGIYSFVFQSVQYKFLSKRSHR